MIAISNARIVTVAHGVIPSGTVLVNDAGKIEAVGAALAVPPGAKTIDAGGRTLTPGLVDAYSHLGLIGQGMGPAGDDADESSEPNTAQVRALDGIYPLEPGIAEARAGGVTTVQVVPRSTNVLAGEALALKLRTTGAVDRMVLKRPTAMVGGLGERPKAHHGQTNKKLPATRMGIAAVLREALVKAQEYQPDKGRDLKLEALQPVLRGEIPLALAAHRADDIVTGLRIAREFGVKLVLLGCTEGFAVADLIAEAGAAVAAGPSLMARTRQEAREVSHLLPVALAAAGVKTALVSGHPELPAQYLNIEAGLAAAAGLEDALRAVTLTPAEIIGVADRVGSIERGKDADLVLWDGDPFELMTRVVWTMIEGQVVYAC